METQKNKCTFKEHKEIDAISYCQECQIYMCNKCLNYHKGLFEIHHLINADENITNIFNGYCTEKNHPNKLNYFCKNHNKLCCAACIAKINEKGDGQHKECNVCIIENIVEEKKNNLKNNINNLENLYNGLEKSIDEIQKLFLKINENKEELKLKVQKIFTKIRNLINDREDELLKEIDEQFNNLYFNESTIKDYENLPKKIKISIDNVKKINEDWENNDNLISLINDCINIEDNIENINSINKKIIKFNHNLKIQIKFIPEEKGIEKLLETIKMFGNVYYIEILFLENALKI